MVREGKGGLRVGIKGVETTYVTKFFIGLGMRQPCRDYVTMFSGHKIVDYCIMLLNIFRIFSGH